MKILVSRELLPGDGSICEECCGDAGQAWGHGIGECEKVREREGVWKMLYCRLQRQRKRPQAKECRKSLEAEKGKEKKNRLFPRTFRKEQGLPRP